MRNQQTEYTVRVKGEVSDLTTKVKNARSSLDSLLKSSHAPKGLEKAFEKVE